MTESKAVGIPSDLVDLTSVPAILRGFSMEKAPDVVKVTHRTAKVVYLKQETGYCGIPILADGKPYKFSHHICMVGSKVGVVTPPTATRMLAQDDPRSRGIISNDQYRAVLKHTLATIIQALSGESSPYSDLTRDVSRDIGAPEWVTTSEGNMSYKEVVDLGLAGMEDHFVEFCQVTGRKMSIDPHKYLRSLEGVHPEYVRVEDGEWDWEAAMIAKHIRMKTGTRLLAQSWGLTMKQQPKRPKLTRNGPPRPPATNK